MNSFEEELRSGFRNLNRFDDPWNQEISEVLRKRPASQLEILARVLPLGVFWERTSNIEKRQQLQNEEREVVAQLRIDYDRLCKERFSAQVERVSKSRSCATSEEFRSAIKIGKRKVEEISSQWACEFVTAGEGEWGIVSRRSSVTTTVSLNLGPDFSLRYHIGIFDTIRSRSLRSQDDYFKVLGLGAGGWKIAQLDQVAEKIDQISEFASWHLQEYRRIFRDIVQL